MAYFPNGTAGMVLDEQCDKCLIDHDWPCPILLAQTHYNYDQCDIPKMQELLNMLVDSVGYCMMKPLLDKMTPEYFERKRLENNGQMSLF